MARNLKRGLPADESDDEDEDTGNSSEDEPEFEKIENKEKYFPINPYEHYIQTGSDNYILSLRCIMGMLGHSFCGPREDDVDNPLFTALRAKVNEDLRPEMRSIDQMMVG